MICTAKTKKIEADVFPTRNYIGFFFNAPARETSQVARSVSCATEITGAFLFSGDKNV